MDDLYIILSGGFAGMAQILTGYPFDTVKVRYISDNHNKVLSCIKSIQSEGYGQFYRGISSPIVGSLIMNVQTFYLYSWFNKYFHEDPLISGSLTGLGLAFVESPTDLVKTRMQTNPNVSYSQTLKNIGVRNIYKGINITLLRNSISCGMYFWGYEKTKTMFTNEYMGILVGGSVSGFCCWAPNYPMDNIKTRIQSDITGKYKGIIDCIKKTPAKKLWAGFTPCIVRSMLVNPFVFLAYELGIKYLQ